MLFEVSDYSSSDDEVPIIQIAPRVRKLPQTLTIDSLFESRKKELNDSSKQIVKKKEIEEPNDPQLNLIKQKINLDEYTIPEIKVINESIFNQTENPFPMTVFSCLKTKPNDNQQYSIISTDQIHYLSFFDISLIYLTEKNVYQILYSLLHTQNERYGRFLLRILSRIPKLDFSKFLFFFKKIIDTSNHYLFIYPAILCNISHFEPTQDIQDDVFLLYISMIICTSISKHQYFHLITENFYFSNPNFALIQSINLLINGSQIQGIGNLVTYLNITKDTAEFFISLYVTLINSLFLLESSIPTNFPKIIDSLILLIPKLKDLIDSKEEEQILRASAILTLIEQIIVAAKTLKILSHDQASLICKALKFNLMGENGTYLFLLKEQLHVTLTQIEYIAETTLNQDDNPFFH